MFVKLVDPEKKDRNIQYFTMATSLILMGAVATASSAEPQRLYSASWPLPGYEVCTACTEDITKRKDVKPILNF